MATKTPDSIAVNPALIARVLGFTAAFLVAASLFGQIWLYKIGQWHRIIRVFNVDAEANVPTWFSTCLLAFIALALLVTYLAEKATQSPDARYWAILSGGFFLMSIEETASLHERMGAPIRAALGGGSLGILHFAWVIPAIGLLIVLVIGFWKFLFRLPLRYRVLFIAAGSIYVTGAVGFEMIGGWYQDAHGEHNLTYNLLATIEESLEMGGLIFFVWGLTRYLNEYHAWLQLKLAPTPVPARAVPVVASVPVVAYGSMQAD